jgi:hypothetical protein
MLMLLFMMEIGGGFKLSREGVICPKCQGYFKELANSIYNGNDGFKIGYTTSSTPLLILCRMDGAPLTDFMLFFHIKTT